MSSLTLLAEDQNKHLFQNLSIGEAKKAIEEFCHPKNPTHHNRLLRKCSKEKIKVLKTNISWFIDGFNTTIRTLNNDIEKNCSSSIFETALKIFTLGYASLKEKPIYKELALLKIDHYRASFVIQRAWRHHLRKKLTKEKLTYEEWKVKVIQNKWQDVTEREIQRLKQTKGIQVYNPIWKMSWLLNEESSSSQELTILLGRIQEIKKIYTDSHYIFTHGQSTPLFLITQTILETVRHFTPERYHPHAPSFRLPDTVPYAANVNEFTKRHNINSAKFIDDNVNLELLSVDAYLWNTDSFESAIDFLLRNNNICTMQNSAKLHQLLQLILHHYVNNNFIQQQAIKKILPLIERITKESKLGVMYAICVPKILVDLPKRAIAYRAHPFGRKCTCHAIHKDKEVLNTLQQGKNQSCGFTRLNKPQYRLLTSSLHHTVDGKRQRGVRAFPITALKRATEETYKQTLGSIIEAFHFYLELYKMKKTLTTQQEATFLASTLSFIENNKELDTAVIVPLIRRRAREKIFSLATRNTIFDRLGVHNRENTRDEYWIGAETQTSFSLSSIWNAVASIFGY